MIRLRKTACCLAAAVMLAALPLWAEAAESLVPMGCAVGISLQTGGVMVAGFAEIETAQGKVSPAAEAGLAVGDVITAVDGRTTGTAAEFLTAVAALDGRDVEVTADRSGRELLLRVTPAKTPEGAWQMGLWLRDGISGIGTVTYYDPETGCFGALGHGISDLDSGELLPFRNGSITATEVQSVVKGTSGSPGELCGEPARDCILGTLEKNTDCGIFGRGDFAQYGTALPVASEEEVHLGPASILSTVSGDGTEEYSIEISRIYRQAEDHRFLLLTVTDPRLLERTGGIVQGMSGSPILQDGKIIGAVTHVLISDAARGYGISISDMLEAA